MERKAVLSVLFALGFIAFASAQPVLVPEWYDGVAYLDGKPAPKDTSVVAKAHASGEVVGSGVVYNSEGGYELAEGVIFENNLGGVVDEGASPGEALDWYVGGFLAYSPVPGADKAESGGFNRGFNLYASSRSCRTPTPAGVYFAYGVGLVLAFLFFEALFFLSKRLFRK